MEYIITQISGKQYLMELDKWYDIDFIENVKINDIIILNKILLFCKNNKVQLGYPFLSNMNIYAKILRQIKNKKIVILKTKPKKHYTRTHGHRQKCTRIILKNNIKF
jgi:large subunit ribosomal protein L21